MGYHTGSVWPHDNALIAMGMARYGLEDGATRSGRVCSRPGRTSTSIACRKTVLRIRPGAGGRAGPLPGGLCPPGLVGGLGVPPVPGLPGTGDQWAGNADASLNRPQLPASLGELRIHNLDVAGATVDLLLVRHEHGVSVDVLRREGDVQITVVK